MKFKKSFTTNSSSSCFVCETKLSTDKIEEKLQKLIDFYNDVFNRNEEFNDIFGDINISCSENELDGHYKGTTKDKMLIYSACDNTIPYWMNDIIEELFDGMRIHLG